MARVKKLDFGYWGTREVYQVDEATAGTTYLCYSDAVKRTIKRVSVKDSVTTIEWAYGEWEKRSELEYVPICRKIEVTEE